MSRSCESCSTGASNLNRSRSALSSSSNIISSSSGFSFRSGSAIVKIASEILTRVIQGASGTMSLASPATLELTIQSTTTSGSYRLVAQYTRVGHPRVQRERNLSIDVDALHELVVPKEYGVHLGKLLFAEGIRELFVQGRNEPG